MKRLQNFRVYLNQLLNIIFHFQDFKYVDTFGEQLVGKSDPVIVLLTLDASSFIGGKFKVLAREAFEGTGFRPGRLVFGAGNAALLGSAVQVEPRRLGAVYCDNRPKVLFKIDLENDEGK